MKKYSKQKKIRFHSMYIAVAKLIGDKMSFCRRRKVGAVLVKSGRIISMGWNGTRSGEDNTCEDENNNTKPTVVHAEINCLSKLVSSIETSKNSTLYCSTAPCINCAKVIVDSKIKKVIYSDIYRDDHGLQYLNAHGIKTKQIQ